MTTKYPRTIHDFPDLGFAVIAQQHPTYHSCIEFLVCELTGNKQSGPPYGYGTDEHTENIDDAELYMRGHVAWDGESTFEFKEQVWGRQGLLNIGELMARCWDIAASRLDGFCGRRED